MREITEERVVKEVVGYEATDGTRFDSIEECRKYEDSAQMVLRRRFTELIVGETTEETLWNSGFDDTTMYIVMIRNEKDVDTVNQYGILVTHSKKCEIVYDGDIGNEVIIAQCEDCFWRKGTLKEMINKITKNYNEAKEMYEKEKRS